MKAKSICVVKDCDRGIHALGLCRKHYLQIRKNGKLLGWTRYDKQKIITEGAISYVVLCDLAGRESGRAIVDTVDVPLISRYKWYLLSSGYAATRMDGRTALMHRLINKTPRGYLTDHINRNKLDNRGMNLRTCNESGNRDNIGSLATNKSKIKGVYLHKATGKWSAEKIYKGKRYYFGLFDTCADARNEYERRTKEIRVASEPL